MRTLKIKSLGPVKSAEIIFQRFCFLIGPESSGKSTVAKILSSCLWIEKMACTSLDEKCLAHDDFRKDLESFHKLEGYFNEDTEISYASAYISIHFSRGKLSCKFLYDGGNYVRHKILYLPSDRSAIFLKDVRAMPLGLTNFRSCLLNWVNCRSHYTKENMLSITGLNTRYYYDEDAENSGKSGDYITVSSDSARGIPLFHGSGGTRAAVLLFVILDFYLKGYYQTYDHKKRMSDLTYGPNKCMSDLQREQKLTKTILRKYSTRDEVWKADLYTRLTKPQRTVFIIEEPELHLFPGTQSALVAHIVKSCTVSFKEVATNL